MRRRHRRALRSGCSGGGAGFLRGRPAREVLPSYRTRQWLGNFLAAVMVLTASAVGWNEWRKSPSVDRIENPAPRTADTLTVRRARELDAMRKIALDAERRTERASAPSTGPSGDGASNPLHLPTRIWQNMSAPEQETLRLRWSRMSPEQQRHAITAFRQRDSTMVRFPPRVPQPPTRQVPP